MRPPRTRGRGVAAYLLPEGLAPGGLGQVQPHGLADAAVAAGQQQGQRPQHLLLGREAVGGEAADRLQQLVLPQRRQALHQGDCGVGGGTAKSSSPLSARGPRIRGDGPGACDGQRVSPE